MKRIISILTILFTITSLSHNQIKTWDASKAKKPLQLVQWEVNDLVYHIKKKVEKPFQKQAFALVSDENTEQKIPLFYNGDKQWVFRYSSSTIGKKSFVIASEIKELLAQKGSLIISKNEKKDRYGGIVRNNEDPRHFYYEDGSHYFNLAFECDWLYALDYGNAELPKTKHLLSLLKENGFNQVVMNVFAYGLDLDWVRDERLKSL